MTKAKQLMLEAFYGKSDFLCVYQVIMGPKTWIVRDETELSRLIKNKSIEDAYLIAALSNQAIED